METKNNTASAPVVVAETETAPVVVAEKTSNKPVVIQARKSLMGKWEKVGAPPKEVIGLTKAPKRGAFTKSDIFNLNGATISMLTITKRIKQLREAGKLCLMAEKAKHEGPGRPPELFNFDLSKAEAKKKSGGGKGAGKKKTGTVETSPVVPTEAPPSVAPEAVPANAAPTVVAVEADTATIAVPEQQLVETAV